MAWSRREEADDDWLDDDAAEEFDDSNKTVPGEACQSKEKDCLSREQDGLSKHDARAIGEQFHNIGYLQAYDETKEVRLQEGFQEGYKKSFAASMRLGQILGEVTTRLQHASSAESSSDEAPDTAPAKHNVLGEQAAKVAKEVHLFLHQLDASDEDLVTTDKPSDLLNLEDRLKELMKIKDQSEEPR